MCERCKLVCCLSTYTVTPRHNISKHMHNYQQSKAQPQNQPCNCRIMSVITLNICQLSPSTENTAVLKGTTDVNAITQMARKHLQKKWTEWFNKKKIDQVTNQPTNQTNNNKNKATMTKNPTECVAQLLHILSKGQMHSLLWTLCRVNRSVSMHKGYMSTKSKLLGHFCWDCCAKWRTTFFYFQDNCPSVNI